MTMTQKTSTFRPSLPLQKRNYKYFCEKLTDEKVEALKVQYKAEKQQLEQNGATFPCMMRTLDHRAYGEQPD